MLASSFLDLGDDTYRRGGAPECVLDGCWLDGLLIYASGVIPSILPGPPQQSASAPFGDEGRPCLAER